MSREHRATLAVAAARTFIAAAERWLALKDIDRITGSRQGGEMQRASMALTRALADLRQHAREDRR